MKKSTPTGFTKALRRALRPLPKETEVYAGQYVKMCKEHNTGVDSVYRAFIRMEKKGELIFERSEPSEKSGKERKVYKIGVILPEREAPARRRAKEEVIEYVMPDPIPGAGVWGLILTGSKSPEIKRK